MNFCDGVIKAENVAFLYARAWLYDHESIFVVVTMILSLGNGVD